MKELEHARLFQISDDHESMACQIVEVAAAERENGGVKVVGWMLDPTTGEKTDVRMFVIVTREDAARIARDISAAGKAGGWAVSH